MRSHKPRRGDFFQILVFFSVFYCKTIWNLLKKCFFVFLLIKGLKSGWVLRIEPDKSFQKMVEISIFDRFLRCLWSKYYFIFEVKNCKNDICWLKSFSAVLQQCSASVPTIFRECSDSALTVLYQIWIKIIRHFLQKCLEN